MFDQYHQRPNDPARLLRMHLDDAFLRSRLRQFIAPFVPIAMIGAGTLIALTLVVQWLKHSPDLALLVPILGIGSVVSFALAPVLRWSALQLRSNMAGFLGCLYIATLSTLVTVAFAQANSDITGSLSFIVILAIAPVAFWLTPWQYAAGFACAFIPPTIAMLTLEATASHWSLLMMVAIFALVVGSFGGFVISACLYIIHEQNHALQTMSREDDLTGLFRRRYWNELASQQLMRLGHLKHPATLLYVDLDGFKAINDTHGHAVGDDVLRTTARTLATALPADAICGRPGGDEFVALLPRTRAAEAQMIANLFRERLAEAEAPANTLDASIGIAEWSPGEHLDTLVHRADHEMLRRKRETRKNVAALYHVVHPPQRSAQLA